jgi:hypothetical protein
MTRPFVSSSRVKFSHVPHTFFPLPDFMIRLSLRKSRDSHQLLYVCLTHGIFISSASSQEEINVPAEMFIPLYIICLLKQFTSTCQEHILTAACLHIYWRVQWIWKGCKGYRHQQFQTGTRRTTVNTLYLEIRYFLMRMGIVMSLRIGTKVKISLWTFITDWHLLTLTETSLA